jgi:very-short-patch-repair endonuclease
VIDGPPGTGKSQTIANLIGAFLYEQKTVLFVSEKAAALEVVRDRLAENGLADYVLELHSHRATRKEVAAALGEALANKPKAPKSMTKAEIDRVKSLREELAAASEAANRIREPLGSSFNQVAGIVAGLAAIPDAPECTLNAQLISLDILSEVRRLGQRSQHSWRPVSERNNFPWRGARSRSPYETTLSKGQSALTDLEVAAEPIRNWIDSFNWELSSMSELLTIIQNCHDESTLIVESWLVAPTLASMEMSKAKLERLLGDHRVAGEKLGALLDINLPVIDTLELPDFSQVTTSRDGWRELQIDDLDESARAATRLAGLVADYEKAAGDIDEIFEVDRKLDLSGAEFRQSLLQIATSDLKPPIEWFKGKTLDQMDTAAARLRAVWDKEVEFRHQAENYWTNLILGARPKALQLRFANIHHGLKRFSSAYRADKQILLSAGQPGQKVKTLIGVLALAVNWKDAIRMREAAENEFAIILASEYHGEGTHWSTLSQRVENGKEIRRLLGKTLTEAQAQLMTGDAEVSPSIEGELLPSIEAFITAFVKDLPNLPHYSETLRRKSAPQLALALQHLLGWLEQCSRALAAVEGNLKTGVEPTAGSLAGISQFRRERRAVEEELKSTEAEFAAELGAFYQGVVSDLATLFRAHELTIRLRRIARGALSPIQVRLVLTADTSAADTIQEVAKTFSEIVTQLVGLFDDESAAETKRELEHFDNARDFMKALAEDSSGQQEWLDFKEITTSCKTLGLEAAIQFCVNEDIGAEVVQAILVKSLLRAWADSILATDVALAKVRSYDKDSIVAEYRMLDRSLVSHAVSPIIESANLLRPQTNLGQSGVIRSEAVKKKRHMSIRDLLTRTEGVAQAIKPVFMMSPLSVSQFLPSSMKFDVVIFDEASQVRPSDAINCIYRGSSVIIAGDDRQLPPSNYWDSAASDDDEEADDNDAADFESILDIAKRAMPSRSLLWHYRSRHEDLITFSNRSFYDGKLFTFPSARQESNELGVAFFKVPGTYRRGTTRDNPEEARSVAIRVEHHFDSRPNRSLGVVTFSDAQRETVEREIDLLRARRPDLEGYFASNRLHGFFIKNLESVQGDERDVIIFSIGYGKDVNGKMTNNFGPINRPKGWRRLNVAITRALYRVEVVSTISAGDIASPGTEEVRFFQQYLAYAEHGPKILDIEYQTTGGETESPFEDSVLHALQSWGYNVRSQVGTAGYRIDLGIEHPERPGIFILGIECDGYAYHSSQVARDRDRLRQQVLEGLGWKLHRIWGTSWYRHQNEEKDRLKKAIENAMSREDAWVGLVPTASTTIVIEREVDEIPDIPEWVDEYKAIEKVTSLPRHLRAGDGSALPYMRKLIEEVVAMEGPVHVSIIEKRLREAWDIGRIGAGIRQVWERALQVAAVVSRGDDFYGLADQEICVRVSVEHQRSVNQVDAEELATAMYLLVTDARAISDVELFKAIARLYGWSRTGSEIQSRLEQSLEAALEWGWIKRSGDTLVPVIEEEKPKRTR